MSFASPTVSFALSAIRVPNLHARNKSLKNSGFYSGSVSCQQKAFAENVLQNKAPFSSVGPRLVRQLAMRSPGSLRVHQTKEDLVSSLSEEIKSAIAAGPAIPGNSREKIAVAVSGGSLPGLLKAAVARDLRSFANLDKALWIMVDERVVPRNHPESNYCAVSEALSGVVPPDQILGVPEEALSGSTDSIALKYEQLLRSKGISPSDIALALLGMGEDGHTASLFPRTWASAVDVSGTRFYVGVDDSPKAPPRRITLTLSAINAAHKRVFVVTGRNKATAVNHIFQEGNSQRLPAGLVQNAIWLVDEEAVSGLKKD